MCVRTLVCVQIVSFLYQCVGLEGSGTWFIVEGLLILSLPSLGYVLSFLSLRNVLRVNAVPDFEALKRAAHLAQVASNQSPLTASLSSPSLSLSLSLSHHHHHTFTIALSPFSLSQNVCVAVSLARRLPRPRCRLTLMRSSPRLQPGEIGRR